MKLVDTSVVVDIDRGGVDDRVARLDDEGRHAISVVTLTELRLGVNRQYESNDNGRVDALEALERLLARFEVIDISRSIATVAADIIADLRQRGLPLDDLHDVYIGASARTEQLPVLTSNVDHFARIDGVDAIDWETY